MRIEYYYGLDNNGIYKGLDNLLNELKQEYSKNIKNPQISWNLFRGKKGNTRKIRRNFILKNSQFV